MGEAGGEAGGETGGGRVGVDGTSIAYIDVFNRCWKFSPSLYFYFLGVGGLKSLCINLEGLLLSGVS